MDKVENKIPLFFGICNEILYYIMSFRCPVCYSLSICRWLFNLFKETAAQITSQIYMNGSLNFSWHSGVLAVNRLYELLVQRLAAEAIRPVTLGDMSQSRLNPDNGNHSSNEKILHSEYSSTRVAPKLEEAVVEDDSFHKNGENDSSQPSNEENDDDKIVEEESPGPPSSMETQNKAPKKMVSINDNVEEIYFSKKKKKKKSTEKVFSIEEQVKEEPKPLKSILKVGSNINENWDENK